MRREQVTARTFPATSRIDKLAVQLRQACMVIRHAADMCRQAFRLRHREDVEDRHACRNQERDGRAFKRVPGSARQELLPAPPPKYRKSGADHRIRSRHVPYSPAPSRGSAGMAVSTRRTQ